MRRWCESDVDGNGICDCVSVELHPEDAFCGCGLYLDALGARGGTCTADDDGRDGTCATARRRPSPYLDSLTAWNPRRLRVHLQFGASSPPSFLSWIGPGQEEAVSARSHGHGCGSYAHSRCMGRLERSSSIRHVPMQGWALAPPGLAQPVAIERGRRLRGRVECCSLTGCRETVVTGPSP